MSLPQSHAVMALTAATRQISGSNNIIGAAKVLVGASVRVAVSAFVTVDFVQSRFRTGAQHVFARCSGVQCKVTPNHGEDRMEMHDSAH